MLLENEIPEDPARENTSTWVDNFRLMHDFAQQSKQHAKKHSCVFCGKLYSKIARHLEQVHYNEVEVAKILVLPKKSKARMEAWKLLANKGDFAHNQEARTENKGMILPAYRM